MAWLWNDEDYQQVKDENDVLRQALVQIADYRNNDAQLRALIIARDTLSRISREKVTNVKG